MKEDTHDGISLLRAERKKQPRSKVLKTLKPWSASLDKQRHLMSNYRTILADFSSFGHSYSYFLQPQRSLLPPVIAFLLLVRVILFIEYLSRFTIRYLC